MRFQTNRALFNFRDLRLENRIVLSRPRMHWKSDARRQSKTLSINAEYVQGSGIVADGIDAAPARCWLLRLSRRFVVSIHNTAPVRIALSSEFTGQDTRYGCVAQGDEDGWHRRR